MPAQQRLYLSRFFLGTAILAALTFTFLFLLFPMASVQLRLGSAAAGLEKYYAFLLFAAALGGVASLGFHTWFRPGFGNDRRAAGSSSPARPETPRGVLALQIFLAFFILTRAVLSLDAPLDWDEVARTAELTQGKFWEVIHPFTTMNHPLATTVSALSLEVLGLSKAALRSPTILILAFSLAGWLLLSIRYFGPLIGTLVLAHLAVNGLASWYFHSMRGYLTLMAVSLSLLWLVSKTMEGEKTSGWWLTTLFVSTLFTHAFANFFCVALLLASLVWGCLQRETISKAQARRMDHFLLSGVGILAVLALVMASQLGVLSSTGFLFRGLEETHPLSYKLSRTAMLFGVSSFWVVKVIALLTFVLAWTRRTRWRDDFLGIFLLISLLLVGACLYLLRVEILEGRMLLAFLVPWLIWLGRALMDIPYPRMRTALVGLTFGILLIPPAQQSLTLLNGDVAHFAGHEAFTLELARNEVDRHCVTLSGDPESVYFAEHVYFRFLPGKGSCENDSWAIHFQKGQFGQTYALPQKIAELYRFLFQDAEGRALFAKRASDRLTRTR